ncbi:TniQ family protein [Rhodococcus koreensis]|uniref:TniQ family protein n=1 Tax=Rhodococcus koreensis TaxID=99653 RepID=UPI00366D210D
MRPFHGETLASYLYRLAIANQLHPDDLGAHLTGTRRARAPITLHGLAAATGRSPRSLGHALPELRTATTPAAHPPEPLLTRRRVCRHCAARRDAFRFASTWQPPEVNICPTHRIWIGPPVRGLGVAQLDVSGVPEILHAQRRHYRLARRHGRRTAADAFAEAAHITALWARHAFYDRGRARLIRALVDPAPLTGRLRHGDPVTPVVTYPQTIDLARVLAMPFWRRPASGDTDDLPRFQQHIDAHLGIEYHPENSPYDPLFGWFAKHHDPNAAVRRPASPSVRHRGDHRVPQI